MSSAFWAFGGTGCTSAVFYIYVYTYYMYVCMYIYIYTYMYMYIYIIRTYKFLGKNYCLSGDFDKTFSLHQIGSGQALVEPMYF